MILRKKLKHIFSGFLLGLGCTSAALAFESSEHERISNLALQTAILYYLDNPGGSKARADEAQLLVGYPGKYNLEKTIPGLSSLSYGDVVACVDYFLDPEKMLAEAMRRNSKSAGSDGIPIYNGEDPFINVLSDCHKSSAAPSEQAAHNNHAHFQQEAMLSFRLYHLTAISLGSEGKGGNLFGALVVNAIADHYLQDFFAPGHIVTPRSRLSDVPATAMHDSANESGLNFQPSHMDKLLPIFNYIFLKNGERDFDIFKSFRLQAIKEQLLGRNDAASIDRVIDYFSSKKFYKIRMRGDQRLWDANDSQLAQRILIFLVEARSILDILKSEDSFPIFKWKTNYIPFRFLWKNYEFEGNAPLEAEISFGKYCLYRDSCYPRYGLSNGFQEINLNDSELRIISAFDTKHAYFPGIIYPILGASVHQESMITGPRVGRTAASLEILPGGSIPIATLNFAFLFGATYYYGKPFHGAGPTFRLVTTVPQTELSWGPYFRRLSYQSVGGTQRKWSYGMRLDSGFSSYFTLYIGLGRDMGATSGRILEPGWIGTGGLQFSWPISRTPYTNIRHPSNEP